MVTVIVTVYYRAANKMSEINVVLKVMFGRMVRLRLHNAIVYYIRYQGLTVTGEGPLHFAKTCSVGWLKSRHYYLNLYFRFRANNKKTSSGGSNP